MRPRVARQVIGGTENAFGKEGMMQRNGALLSNRSVAMTNLRLTPAHPAFVPHLLSRPTQREATRIVDIGKVELVHGSGNYTHIAVARPEYQARPVSDRLLA